MNEITQITLSVIIGFCTGLGISFIVLGILVYLGVKEMRNADINTNIKGGSPEIT